LRSRASCIRDGANEISIVRKSGSGPLYFLGRGGVLQSRRTVEAGWKRDLRAAPVFQTRESSDAAERFRSERVPLNDGETVKSGDRVEVVLTVEAKNNYEYLLFEDLKPAGLEAVQIRSGESLTLNEFSMMNSFYNRPLAVFT
jgi:uncharacterized protein YfaS (alpha-2-macroglobulin family)